MPRNLYVDKIMKQVERIGEPTRTTTTGEMINPNMAQGGSSGINIGQILQLLMLQGAFQKPGETGKAGSETPPLNYPNPWGAGETSTTSALGGGGSEAKMVMDLLSLFLGKR